MSFYYINAMRGYVIYLLNAKNISLEIFSITMRKFFNPNI
jgi:hypothetical protein